MTYLFRRPRQLGRALVAMNVLMPLFALALNALFDFIPSVKIALVALAISPIPPPIPAKAMRSGAAGSYVLGLQIAIGLLAIAIVPLAMAILGRFRHGGLQLSIAPVAMAVLVTIVIPIGAGILLHRWAPAFAERVARPLTSISGLAIVFCVVVIWISAAPEMWSLLDSGTGAALAAFVLTGMAIGHALGGPAPESRTSLAIATASRHPGVALLLARANFPEEQLIVPTLLLYLLVNAVLAIPYLLWTRRRRRQN